MRKLITILFCICSLLALSVTAFALPQTMEEWEELYGVPEPQPEDYANIDDYWADWEAWNNGLLAFMAHVYGEDTPVSDPDPPVIDDPEPPDPVEDVEQEPDLSFDDPPADIFDEPVDDDKYPVGVYIDPDGNVWSPDGELLSEGQAMPYIVEEVVEVTAVEILEAIEWIGGIIGELQTVMDGMDEEIIDGLNHPLLTTPFEEYSVTEGLLLLLLLYFFISSCIRIIKEGFVWLR